MDGSRPFQVKLTGRLTGITMATPVADARTQAATSSDSSPAQAAAPPPAFYKDLAELTRLAKEIKARERTATVDAALLSVELGVAIAERLVGAAINTDRQRLDRIVLGVLEKMPAALCVTVRGHPGDIALLQSQLATHADWAKYKDLLKFRNEEAGERGKFKIEATDWFVEWDTQRCLTELRSALLEETFADK
jgi:flagellar biosynthesis/type III secretory pathway protein FliH